MRALKWIIATVVVVPLCLILAVVASLWLGRDKDMNESADTAAALMKTWPPVDAQSAASRVVGRNGEGHIELLRAEGDNQTGLVVLRISKGHDKGYGFGAEASWRVGCYEFRFALMTSTAPGSNWRRIGCPDVPDIVPTSKPPSMSRSYNPFTPPGG